MTEAKVDNRLLLDLMSSELKPLTVKQLAIRYTERYPAPTTKQTASFVRLRTNLIRHKLNLFFAVGYVAKSKPYDSSIDRQVLCFTITSDGLNFLKSD